MLRAGRHQAGAVQNGWRQHLTVSCWRGKSGSPLVSHWPELPIGDSRLQCGRAQVAPTPPQGLILPAVTW